MVIYDPELPAPADNGAAAKIPLAALSELGDRHRHGWPGRKTG
jgi:hypothetical protein